MQRKNLFRLGLIALILVITFIALRNQVSAQENSTCKESLDQCPKQNMGADPGGMIWENLSHQFFSFTSCSY